MPLDTPHTELQLNTYTLRLSLITGNLSCIMGNNEGGGYHQDGSEQHRWLPNYKQHLSQECAIWEKLDIWDDFGTNE